MKKFGIALVILVIIVAAGAWYVTRIPSSPLAGVDAKVDEISLEDGEYVARLGDCVACHSVPGGKPFAGGLKMGTPLGAIFSTNITPDKTTGIGDYTLADFDNAVRRGVAKDGHRLYPAMPYPSYAKLTDEDVRKLYAYFMKHVTPVSQQNVASEIPSPWNQRWPLAMWNLAFLHDEPYQTKSGKDPSWNRGAYIVQGLGHCGSCHTPRGFAIQEVALDESGADFLSGALLDGWKASSLNGDPNSGLGRWTEAEIAEFLKTGRNAHATVFGSMMDAFNNSTQFMSDADLAGISKYLKSLPANKEANATAWAYDEATAKALNSGDLSQPGASLFMQQCAFCHGRDGKGRGKNLPPLAGNPTVLDSDPDSIVNLMLNGAGRIVADGVPDSYRMPPFRVLLKDQQIADLATFMRSAWGNKASPVTAGQVKKLREDTDATSDHVIVLRMR